jgi:hypothetical protein
MATVKRCLTYVAGVAVGFGLTACGDGIYVNRTETVAYSGETYVQSSAAIGTNQVVVFNSPYAPDETINSVLTAARERYTSNQYRFFAGPPIADWNGYTVLMAFSDGPLGNQNLCKNRQIPLRPMSGAWTTIFAEYCLGDILVSEVTAYTRPVNGPNDPRFSQLVGSVVSGLFQYRLPTNTGNGVNR